MKKSKFRFVSMLLVCAILLSSVAFGAQLRASDQIRSYSVNVVPSTGSRLAIEISIAGTKSMQLIGGKTITIYEKRGTSWVYVSGIAQNASGMTTSNSFIHNGTVYYNATAGKEYMVTVTLFARDSSGNEDSRTLTYTAVAK